MLKLLARLFTSALLFFLPVIAMAQETPIKQVEQALKKVERSMCQSLDLRNCKTAKSRKQRKQMAVAPAPLPRERPDAKSNPANTKIATSDAPLPKPVLRQAKKPPAAAQPATKPVPKPTPEKTAALIRPEKLQPEKPKLEITPQTSDCAARLTELGATFKPQATPANQGHCSITNAVQLISVMTSGKPIEFSDAPVLSCEFAATLSGWTRDVAGPLVKATTKQPLVAVATGPGFDCRGRNGDGSGKMSEHASGNAVDIGTLKLGDGKVLNVKGSNATLVALRAAACQSFTTVLGPGSNSAHEEHFHFDLARRKNGYRVCN